MMQDQDDAIEQLKELIVSVKLQLGTRIDYHDAKFQKILGADSSKNNKVNSFEKKIEDSLRDIESSQIKSLDKLSA
jgi:hypothetical protein